MNELGPGRIEAQSGEFTVPPRLRKDLEPGTFTFVMEPGIQWGVISSATLIVSCIATMLNGFVVIVFLARFSVEPHYSVVPGLIVGCLTGLYLTIRSIWNNRHPRAKIVFYQPRGAHQGQSYRSPPVDFGPRFEVYFRGKLRDSGYLTHGSLFMHSFAGEMTFKYTKRNAATGWIVLKSNLSLPDPSDPFNSIRTSTGCYNVYTRADELDLDKCEKMMDDLLDFLGLQPHEDTEIPNSEFEAFLEERNLLELLNKGTEGSGKTSKNSIPSPDVSPHELEQRELRSSARVEKLQSRLKMMRRKDLDSN